MRELEIFLDTEFQRHRDFGISWIESRKNVPISHEYSGCFSHELENYSYSTTTPLMAQSSQCYGRYLVPQTVLETTAAVEPQHTEKAALEVGRRRGCGSAAAYWTPRMKNEE